MIFVRGAEDHGRRRFERIEMARGFEPVHDRHADVEQHEIGLQARRGFERVEAIAGFAGDFDAVDLGEQRGQSLARQGFVVNESAFMGTRARIGKAHRHRVFAAAGFDGKLAACAEMVLDARADVRERMAVARGTASGGTGLLIVISTQPGRCRPVMRIVPPSARGCTPW